MRIFLAAAAAGCLAAACARAPYPEAAPATGSGVIIARNSVQPAQGELHFAAVRQLTSGGQNAEAYFSRDGRWLTFQSAQLDYPCDQQYVMRVDGSSLRRVSDGRGKRRCMDGRVRGHEADAAAAHRRHPRVDAHRRPAVAARRRESRPG